MHKMFVLVNEHIIKHRFQTNYLIYPT